MMSHRLTAGPDWTRLREVEEVKKLKKKKQKQNQVPTSQRSNICTSLQVNKRDPLSKNIESYVST